MHICVTSVYLFMYVRMKLCACVHVSIGIQPCEFTSQTLLSLSLSLSLSHTHIHTHTHTLSLCISFTIYTHTQTHTCARVHTWTLHNYDVMKWIRQYGFNSWLRLFKFFHFANTLGKFMHQTIPLPARGKYQSKANFLNLIWQPV